ncbi:secondary thiamine-phosphate synthase enzyme YjbQ [Natrialbaceae archaeon A-CW3]
MSIQVQTSDRVDLVDVTDRVADAVPAGLKDGLCTVYVPHTTAGVIVNEAERRLLSDFEAALERLVPEGEEYEHDSIDDNADAHLRAAMLGESVTIPVVDGGLALGTWQSILFVDCDGPRTRQLRVTVVPGVEASSSGSV